MYTYILIILYTCRHRHYINIYIYIHIDVYMQVCNLYNFLLHINWPTKNCSFKKVRSSTSWGFDCFVKKLPAISFLPRVEDVTKLEGSIWDALPPLEIPFKVEWRGDTTHVRPWPKCLLVHVDAASGPFPWGKLAKGGKCVPKKTGVAQPAFRGLKFQRRRPKPESYCI